MSDDVAAAASETDDEHAGGTTMGMTDADAAERVDAPEQTDDADAGTRGDERDQPVDPQGTDDEATTLATPADPRTPDEAADAGRGAGNDPTRLLAPVAASAAAVLAAASVGSIAVALVFLTVALHRHPRAAAASALGLLATAIRFNTLDFTALAGAQSVLGPAVRIGPPLAATSAVAAVAALVLAAERVPVPAGTTRRIAGVVGALPAVACGVTAATVGVGAGSGSGVVLRIVASVAFVVLALVVSAPGRRVLGARRPGLALLAGLVAVLAAGVPQ